MAHSLPVVLEVRDLTTIVQTARGDFPVVDGVSFHIRKGETFGLIGESGSGKSMTALSLLRLNPATTKIASGSIVIDGVDLMASSEHELRRLRGAAISIILQDPNTALNPVVRVGAQIQESVHIHHPGPGKVEWARVVAALRLLRVPDPAVRARAYPHELSGGMRQRVVSAIALAADPKILIADEATTALDATIQATFLRHLRKIQAATGLAILFITHDFAAVASICHRVGIMYAGRLVEVGDVADIFSTPIHPYTQALIESVPDVLSSRSRLASIPGAPPKLDARPSGCAFHPRCWLYKALDAPAACRTTPPEWASREGQSARCHFPDDARRLRLAAAASEAPA